MVTILKLDWSFYLVNFVSAKNISNCYWGCDQECSRVIFKWRRWWASSVRTQAGILLSWECRVFEFWQKVFNVDSFSIDQTYSYMPLKEFWRYPTFRIYLANECDGLMYEVFMCKWPFAGWSKKKLPILFFIPKLRFTIFFHIFQVV